MPKAMTPEEKMQKVTQQRNEAQGNAPSEVLTELPRIRKAPENPTRKATGVFNGTRGRLKISDEDVKNFEEAGWHLHIFNELAGRIDDALSLGYEFVTREEIGGVVANVVDGNTDMGNKVRFRVGQNEAGDGLFAYLMKIPTSLFLTEQRDLQRKNDLRDQVIRTGKAPEGISSEGFYNAGIKMNSKLE